MMTLRTAQKRLGRVTGTIGFALAFAFLSMSAGLADDPRIAFFRVVPTVLDGERWYEFHWEVLDADRVRLFSDKKEMGARIQLPDGSIGWPSSMSGSMRTKLTRPTTFTLLAEAGPGVRVTESVEIEVADAAPAPAPRSSGPKIDSFRVEPARVRPGQFVAFFWEVQGATSVHNELITEARKFGLGMILASQMSEHFSEEVRANAATWLVLKPMDVREAKKNAPNVQVDPEDLIRLTGRGDGYYRDRPSSRARRIQVRPLQPHS
jgi:hypothetical protein